MRSDTGSDEVERFDWVRESAIQEAACLTFVPDGGVHRVAAGFGAVGDHMRTLDFDEFCEEAYAHHETYAVIGIGVVGDVLLVVEDNGFQGARPEVLRRVSRGTEVTSALWNADGLARFCYAAEGQVRTSFEALVPQWREGADPDALEQIRADLPWAAGAERKVDAVSLMLALCARVTGGVVTPESFSGEFATYPVAEWPPDLPRGPEAVRARIASDYPRDLISELRLADPARCRRVAAELTYRVLDSAEWPEHPVFSTTLRELGSGRPADQRPISEAVREWNWQLRVHRATSRVRNQARAAEVVRQATNDDPLVAVLSVLDKAREVRGMRPADLTGVVRDVLGAR